MADKVQLLDSVLLKGQVALVTGAGRGIGQAIAQTLGAAGASVAVLSRSKNELDETVRVIAQQSSNRALALPADVSDASAVAEAVRRIERELGPVDILINNAGALKPFGPLWENDVSEWWTTMEVNVRGAFLCSRAVLPGMVARGRGRIVNVSSGAGVNVAPFYSSYIVSKCAQIKLTECIALEAAPHGVFAFAISPGTVRTAMTEYSLNSEEGKKWLPWFRRIFDENMNVPAHQSAQLVLQLLSGNYDALSGRMVSIYEDLDRLKASLAEIQQQNLYALKMEPLMTSAANPAFRALLAEARKTAGAEKKQKSAG